MSAPKPNPFERKAPAVSGKQKTYPLNIVSRKKHPKVFDKDQLASKSTKEPLAYLNRLNQCEESFELADMGINADLADSEIIYFKDTPKWRTAYSRVKLILSKREPIEK